MLAGCHSPLFILHHFTISPLPLSIINFQLSISALPTVPPGLLPRIKIFGDDGDFTLERGYEISKLSHILLHQPKCFLQPFNFMAHGSTGLLRYVRVRRAVVIDVKTVAVPGLFLSNETGR